MIKTNNIIIVLFLYLMTGCKSPAESYINAKEYYPLKIGNKWYYSFDQSKTTVFNEIKEIIGATEIDNKSYYKIIVYRLPPSIYSDTSYIRAEKSRLFFGRITNTDGTPKFNEDLVADFSLDKGDTLRIDSYEYLTITEKDESIIEIFHLSSPGMREWTKYQKGIGAIKSIISNHAIHRRVLVKSELK